MAILTNIPAPYRIDQFNRLAASGRFSYKVFFCARTEANRSWDPQEAETEMAFEHEYLRAGLFRRRGGFSYLAPGFLLCLLRERPKAVIVGGFSAQLAMALLYGRLTNARVVIWSDSNILRERKLPPWRTVLRRILVHRVDAAIASSGYGVEYFRFLGVPAERIVLSRCVNEPERFRHEVQALWPYREGLRREQGIPEGSLVALVPARLGPEKGCRELLRAFAAIRGALRPPLHLMFVGDGPLKAELVSLAASLGVTDAVTFWGFRGYREMPRYYAAADFVVLPSLEEHYGLVVNEGLAAGLPILCSQFAGASDLINPGRGLIFDPTDFEGFQRAIEQMVDRCARDAWPVPLPLPDEISPVRANESIEAALLLGRDSRS